MNNDNLKTLWTQKYQSVPEQFEKLKQIPSAATAFNANIDAIIKLSGEQLKQLLLKNNISASEVIDIKLSCFKKPTDVLIGIIKCFSRGIAEEWVTEDINIYSWMAQNLGYDRLQMGGQGGIIANALALLGINKVIAHTNSHPKTQAEQFLDLPNLLGIDNNGELQKATEISREDDIPLIHWIIEFDKGDTFTLDGITFTCPKSNRFIATYDPLNMHLVMNKGFISYMNNNKVDYLLMSGFHPLLSHLGGEQLIENAVPVIKKWKQANPELIVHLEVASTQDKIIRQAIIEKIAPLADSIGLNERETIDLLEISGQDELAKRTETETNSCNLFEAILFLKKKLNVKRIQLHMFGLYLTIQDSRFPYSAEQNLKGMMTAAVVSSSKAYNGEIARYEDVSKTLGHPVSDQGIKELSSLAVMLNKPELLETGICEIDGYSVSAVPTILIDKPKTLVGMGDTISSVSLLAGR
ncbi:MAG: hypothetical protein NC218_10950 [Acetobacter sp.]|nr:hypothetical protein [Acetobacter sp.]